MAETYYVTTPIYYVNDVPHIGHSYTTVAADVLARYFRIAGRDVHFLTGTDEHGIKIVKAAKEKNTTPQQLADEVVVEFRNLWDSLNISNDNFIRTTAVRHTKRVQKLVQNLIDRDEVYLGNYEGWYDEGQEEYVTESAARDNDYKSKINGKPLVRYSEDNWFFRLEKWIPKLIEYIKANPEFIQPAPRRNEVLGKLKVSIESGELTDLCISRNKQKLPWGVEMPNDPSHVVYVWVDALSNYCTALGIPEIGDEYDGKYAKYWPPNVHLIGKDILWFHAVHWPCILMALEIPLPKSIFAHGWWTSEGKKMSKSMGNFISREQIAMFCEEYSCDIYRYYLLRAVSFGTDGDFSSDMFRQIYNSELANGVGNLLSRTVKMIDKYFGGVIPAPVAKVEEASLVKASAKGLCDQSDKIMSNCGFHQYIEKIIGLVGATNSFIDDTAPFKLAKDDSQRERLGTILYTCAEAVRIIMVYLSPIMPDKTAEALCCLGCGKIQGTLRETGKWGGIFSGIPGTKVTVGEPLFPRKQ